MKPFTKKYIGYKSITPRYPLSPFFFANDFFNASIGGGGWGSEEILDMGQFRTHGEILNRD